MDRQLDRQVERQSGRLKLDRLTKKTNIGQTDKQIGPKLNKKKDGQTEKKVNRWRQSQTDIKQVGRQKDRFVDEQID